MDNGFVPVEYAMLMNGSIKAQDFCHCFDEGSFGLNVQND